MDGDITREPVKTPAEAMALAAQLCGAKLGLGIDMDERLPEFRLTFKVGRHEAHLRAWIDMSGEVFPAEAKSAKDLVMVLRIKCEVGWPSTIHSPESAATAAALHTLVAQRAMLVESVAAHRYWRAVDILGDDA